MSVHRWPFEKFLNTHKCVKAYFSGLITLEELSEMGIEFVKPVPQSTRKRVRSSDAQTRSPERPEAAVVKHDGGSEAVRRVI